MIWAGVSHSNGERLSECVEARCANQAAARRVADEKRDTCKSDARCVDEGSSRTDYSQYRSRTDHIKSASGGHGADSG